MEIGNLDFECHSGAVSRQAERPQEVWLLLGQSNMIGFGPKGSELTPQWTKAPGNVMLNVGGDWMPLVAINDAFGAEIGFGHGMAVKFPERDILLIKPLFGLGNIYNDWRSPNTGRGDAGPHYMALMEMVSQAMASRPGAKIAGVLWMQGEGDAHNDIEKARSYDRNLTLFIESLRKDLAVQDMMFVFGQITRSKTWIYSGIVRDAQARVNASVPLTAMFDTDDLSLVPDGIHYDTSGALELGCRFAQAVIGLRKDGLSGLQPPRLQDTPQSCLALKG